MGELNLDRQERLEVLEAKAYMEWGLSDEESKELDNLTDLTNLAEEDLRII